MDKLGEHRQTVKQWGERIGSFPACALICKCQVSKGLRWFSMKDTDSLSCEEKQRHCCITYWRRCRCRCVEKRPETSRNVKASVETFHVQKFSSWLRKLNPTVGYMSEKWQTSQIEQTDNQAHTPSLSHQGYFCGCLFEGRGSISNTL